MKIKEQEIKKNVLKSIKNKNKRAKLEDEKAGLASKIVEEDPRVSDDDDDQESLDSDQELQLAFARKELTPGLNIELPRKKEFVNDQEGLKRKLKDLHLDLEWAERLDITAPKINHLELQSNNSAKPEDIANDKIVDNDFKRESLFLKQAETVVRTALVRLKALNIPTQRPEDYFAEMAKTDEHMKRVRENLLSKHAEMEKREKVRKLREMKKMGKQIQIEAKKKKDQAKKSLKESIKKFKKGDKDSLNIELEDKDEKRERNRQQQSGKDKPKNGNKKLQFKEKKYGFGGRKKRSKYNTADSYAEPLNKVYGKKKRGGAHGGGVNKFQKNKMMNKNKPKKKF